MIIILTEENIRPEYRHLLLEEIEFNHLDGITNRMIYAAGRIELHCGRMIRILKDPHGVTIGYKFPSPKMSQKEKVDRNKNLDIDYYRANWSEETLRDKYKKMIGSTTALYFNRSPYRFEEAALKQAAEDGILEKREVYFKK